MEYRALGRTGLKVSSLCLGTMSWGADADEAEAKRMFAAARDRGVNMVDTADVYNRGEAERILGTLIAGCRDQVVIATKSYFPTGKDVNARGSSRYHLINAVEASLSRLATDRIDIFYLHRFDDALPLEETLRALEQLVAQGKILYPAASNFAAWQVARALGIADKNNWSPMCCVQPMYNLIKRQAEVEILPMAGAEGLGVFPYSPVGGGMLSGKYGVDRKPDSGRIVDNNMYSTRYGSEQNYAIASAFSQAAKARGLSPVTLAVAWVASHPAVTAPIIGARNAEQLTASLAALDVNLTPEERAELSNLSPAPPPATDRNEETTTFNYGAKLSK